MAGQRVADVMTETPRAVGTDTPMVEAARTLRDEDAGSLPVVANDRVIGIVTDRDIAVRLVAEGRDPKSTVVGEVYSGEPVSVRPEDDLDEAMRLMARHQVRRLPVVEDGDRLVGIVAQADVALEGDDAKAGEVVEKVSRPTSEPRR